MRLAVIGVLLLVAGGIAAATGALPDTELAALADRVVPILVFVAAITVVTELASEAGAFLWAGRKLRRWGFGSSLALWLLLALLATLSTIFLSLDTTAVLLTPVVVTVVRQAGLPPLPFVLTTVWLANTASLLLPVSNLTNLLAQHSLGGLSPAGFAALMWAPALACVLVPLAFIAIVFRRDLRLRYGRAPKPARAPGPAHTPDPGTDPASGPANGSVSAAGTNTGKGKPGGAFRHPATDRFLLAASGIVLLALLPLLVSGMPVWIPATAAAVVLVLLFAVRRRQALTIRLVPWPLLLFASGLFLAMESFLGLGGSALLGILAGQGQDFAELLRLAATGAVGANAVNNLPAYLLAEPLADTPERMAALLIGVNAGPLVTPWASLATLLWHDRLRRMNVVISWKGYAVFGLIVAPLTLLAAVAALAFTA
ncbi:arsenic transporter [Arthrobacter gandavensis]|uniref:SLC13 family permease n=1 Tax=Arthrobacter gandavensis TaxID=169960 RepID=UPI00188ECA4F|nr:SLC13 family permease [Arthrobacter gandavensis]MBF4992756.1 arsenic transporter [Arthrobacter gandavensis]